MCFRLTAKDEVPLIVGIQLYDVIVSGEKNVGEKCFAQQKKRLPVIK